MKRGTWIARMSTRDTVEVAHQHRLNAVAGIREEELPAGNAEQKRRDRFGGGANHLLQAGARHGDRPQPVDERYLRTAT